MKIKAKLNFQLVDCSWYAILLASQLLVGLGAAPLFTLGISYMDENVLQKEVSMYLGRLASTKIDPTKLPNFLELTSFWWNETYDNTGGLLMVLGPGSYVYFLSASLLRITSNHCGNKEYFEINWAELSKLLNPNIRHRHWILKNLSITVLYGRQMDVRCISGLILLPFPLWPFTTHTNDLNFSQHSGGGISFRMRSERTVASL